MLNKKGTWSKSLVKGMVQLIDAIGLKAHLPEALTQKTCPHAVGAVRISEQDVPLRGSSGPVKEREKFQSEMSGLRLACRLVLQVRDRQ